MLYPAVSFLGEENVWF